MPRKEPLTFFKNYRGVLLATRMSYTFAVIGFNAEKKKWFMTAGSVALLKMDGVNCSIISEFTAQKIYKDVPPDEDMLDEEEERMSKLLPHKKKNN